MQLSNRFAQCVRSCVFKACSGRAAWTGRVVLVFVYILLLSLGACRLPRLRRVRDMVGVLVLVGVT